MFSVSRCACDTTWLRPQASRRVAAVFTSLGLSSPEKLPGVLHCSGAASRECREISNRDSRCEGGPLGQANAAFGDRHWF
jgi:hypothetical protein